jgi:hypothetical protein
MIPTARRAASSSLPVVRNAQGRHVARNVRGARTGAGGNNVTVARLGGGRLQQIRGLSSTTPTRSALDLALKPKEDIVKGEGKDEEPLGRPEHAVISTFDLFSIGGPYSYPLYCLSESPDVMFPLQLVRAVHIPSVL